MFEKLEHIGIMVADIDRSIAFYQDVLDLPLVERRRRGEVELAFFQLGECQLELVAGASGYELTDGVVNHVAFTVRDLAPVVAKLEQAGVEILNQTPIDLWDGCRAVFFRGPDGERLELFERPA